MSESTWDLALAELIFYLIALIPALYCLWQHRRQGLLGWIYFIVFVGLQLVGAAMRISAGQSGTPSVASVIITSIGLSPLLLGTAGVIHEWTTATEYFSNKRKAAFVVYLLFHIAVGGATIMYAKGASKAEGKHSGNGGTALWKAGVVLIALLWLLLCTIFGMIIFFIGRASARVLTWSITLSLTLLGLRVIYQCVATFDYQDKAVNPRDGNIALQVIFDFLTGALIIVVMIIGGFVSLPRLPKHVHQPTADRLENHTELAGYRARGKKFRCAERASSEQEWRLEQSVCKVYHAGAQKD